MRRQLIAAILATALPLAALAQGGQQGAGAPPAQGNGAGYGPQGGPGKKFDPQRMEKRMKLARTLGLAEALDLDAPAALKLGDTMAKFDERRAAVHKQLQESGQLLRRAAQGEKVPAADVDQAIQKALDARAQLLTINREMVGAVTKDLSPDKKARAVIFLAKFQRRFMAGPHHMMGPGMGPGGGWHRGQGGGPGMGPGGGGGMGGGMGMMEDEGGPSGPMMGMAMTPPGGDELEDDL
jgi:hypothetical protein